MPDKHYIGLDLISFEDNGKQKPVSRVTLFVDDENWYTAGDDTGREITAECPSATQEMAENLLAALKGAQHQKFSAQGAALDPAAELGDGVTIGGIYTTLTEINDKGGYPDIAAPGEAESEDEFPYESPMQKEFNRKIAQTRAEIKKTSEEIALTVEQQGKSIAEIKVRSDEIDQTVVKKNTVVAAINLSEEGVKIAANKIELQGAVSFSSLDNATQQLVQGAADDASAAKETVSSLEERANSGEFKGETGPEGPHGVGVKSSVITYQASSDGTTAPTGTWSSSIPSVSSGQYLWTRTVITYTDGSTSTSYSVGRNGTNGTNGTNGVGVAVVYRYCQLASSIPAKPTAYPPASPWSTTEPTYKTGSTQNLYITECTVYTDGTFSYTPVSLSSSYAAAKDAYSYVEQLAGNIYKPGTTLIDGDKLYTGSVGANKINVADLFAQTITMSGKFTSSHDVFLEPGIEEIETIRAHILGTATIPSNRLALYDFNGDGIVGIQDLLVASNAYYGRDSLADWSGAELSTVTITIDMSDPVRTITISGTNMWGRYVETAIGAFPHLSTFTPKDLFESMFAYDQHTDKTKVVSSTAELPPTTVNGNMSVTGDANITGGVTANSVNASGTVHADGGFTAENGWTVMHGGNSGVGLLSLPDYLTSSTPTATVTYPAGTVGFHVYGYPVSGASMVGTFIPLSLCNGTSFQLADDGNYVTFTMTADTSARTIKITRTGGAGWITSVHPLYFGSTT